MQSNAVHQYLVSENRIEVACPLGRLCPTKQSERAAWRAPPVSGIGNS